MTLSPFFARISQTGFWHLTFWYWYDKGRNQCFPATEVFMNHADCNYEHSSVFPVTKKWQKKIPYMVELLQLRVSEFKESNVTFKTGSATSVGKDTWMKFVRNPSQKLPYATIIRRISITQIGVCYLQSVKFLDYSSSRTPSLHGLINDDRRENVGKNIASLGVTVLKTGLKKDKC